MQVFVYRGQVATFVFVKESLWDAQEFAVRFVYLTDEDVSRLAPTPDAGLSLLRGADPGHIRNPANWTVVDSDRLGIAAAVPLTPAPRRTWLSRLFGR